jgi:hypothetical protein
MDREAVVLRVREPRERGMGWWMCDPDRVGGHARRAGIDEPRQRVARLEHGAR